MLPPHSEASITRLSPEREKQGGSGDAGAAGAAAFIAFTDSPKMAVFLMLMGLDGSAAKLPAGVTEIPE